VNWVNGRTDGATLEGVREARMKSMSEFAVVLRAWRNRVSPQEVGLPARPVGERPAYAARNWQPSPT
jgi:hypothetical protein